MKIIEKAKHITLALESCQSITGEHAAAIEIALNKVERLFGTLSQLGCSDSKAYMIQVDLTDQIFLGIPPVSTKSAGFTYIPWTLAPTHRLGKWLHVPMAMIMG